MDRWAEAEGLYGWRVTGKRAPVVCSSSGNGLWGSVTVQVEPEAHPVPGQFPLRGKEGGPVACKYTSTMPLHACTLHCVLSMEIYSEAHPVSEVHSSPFGIP